MPSRKETLIRIPRFDPRALIIPCAVTAVLVATLWLAGLPAMSATADTLRVSYTPFRSTAALFMGEREGYFAAERIKLTWVPFVSGQQFVPVLVQGQLDVGAAGASAGFFNAVSAGQKIRIVAGMGYGAGPGSLGSLVVRRGLAGIVKSAADLRGRRVATNGIGTLGHYFLAKTLASGGLTTDDVTMVIMPFSASVAALQSGAIDAANLSAPLDAEAVDSGVGFILVDVATVIPGEPASFLFFGSTLLEQNRALGLRFMTAYLRGVARYNEGPTPSNIAALADFLKIPPAMARKGGWAYVYVDGFVDVVKLRRYQDWLFEIGMINVRNPIVTVVDAALVGQARAVLGLGGR